jgi:pimeloyl-ACP methyl ester carboxylesterase
MHKIMTFKEKHYYNNNKSHLEQTRGLSIFIVVIIGAVLILFLPLLTNTIWAQTTQFIPLLSTRGNFDLSTGELLPRHNSTDYLPNNIPGLQIGQCPKEVVIFVHGIWVDGTLGRNALGDSSEIFDRVRMSLTHNNYRYPLVGFSWDSNTIISSDGSGWNIAKLIAKDNGPKLAQFLLDYKNTCRQQIQDIKIRLVSHSMGARVILSALESLDSNQEWNRHHFKIASVHLLGAAVDDDEVSKNILYIVRNPSSLFNRAQWFDPYGIKSAYGKAVQDIVLKFYNLYNPHDKVLGHPNLYRFYDQDTPLGLNGAQVGIARPSNYIPIDVQNKIAPLCDANGDNRPDPPFESGVEVGIGDNHAGYIGFRDSINKKILIDDGAIGVVVSNWNNSIVPEKQYPSSTAIC